MLRAGRHGAGGTNVGVASVDGTDLIWVRADRGRTVPGGQGAPLRAGSVMVIEIIVAGLRYRGSTDLEEAVVVKCGRRVL